MRWSRPRRAFEVRVIATFMLLLIAVLATMGAVMAFYSPPEVVSTRMVLAMLVFCVVCATAAVCVIPELWRQPIRSDAETVNSRKIKDVPVSGGY